MPVQRRRPRRPARGRVAAGSVLALGLGAGLAGCGQQDDEVTVGLITKQEENPYWVTMREVAQETADERGAELVAATGASDVDVDAQLAALERMTEDGVDGILIAPTDSSAVVPAIEAAREAGVMVIAVDTPTEPESAVDAFLATDNFAAGELIGRYASARAEEEGIEPVVAMLDLAPGISSGELRREGFLEGFGVDADDPQVVASVDTEGDEDLARDAMAQLLAEHEDISVVYTVNEPAALGAIEAIEAAGRSLDEFIIVSVDGGCEAIKNAVRPGDIDATAQQFPENMAREGVRMIVEAARGGEPPSGYLDTGVQLITGTPVPGVQSRDVAFGVRNCWGD